MTSEVMRGAEPTYTPGEAAGVLLLHDLGSTPQLFRSMADALQAADMAVDVPLLPGHGTNIEDLATTSWDDWSAAAQLALDELASRSGPVVVVGIAMGATLGSFVAANHPSVVGIVAINPRAMPIPEQAYEMLQAMLDDGVENLSPLGHDVSDRTAEIVAYDTVPVTTLISMFQAVNDMAEHWGEMDIPMLIVTSGRDHRVSPHNAVWLAERVGGQVERLNLERSFHEATVDVERKELEEAIITFIHKVTASA